MANVQPYLVGKAVIALLRSELDVPIGYGTVPSSDRPALMGYLVVNFIPPMDVLNEGYGLGKGAMKRLRYQLTAVGVQADQAELLAGAAVGVLVDEENNEYVNDILVAGHSVYDRRESGAIPTSSVDSTVNAGFYVDLSVQAV